MKKKVFFTVILLIFLLLCGLFAFSYLFFFHLPAVSTAEQQTEKLFTVKKGMSMRAIAAQLHKEALIRSEYMVYLYFRLSKKGVQAGTYKLSQRMPMYEVCTYLETGKQEYIKVTIPEGMTLSKIAGLLEKKQVISGDLFFAAAKNEQLLSRYGISAASAEGFLFPDTYLFTYNETAERVLTLLLDNFFLKIKTLPNIPKDSNALYDAVILASIIEREYRLPEEAPKIAGVFHNRLSIGMGLQSCATIEYIITEIQQQPHPARLFKKDLEINNPYNTYKWRGLPPGPIASPGLTALHAACNPERNQYFFFRLDDPTRGNHIFTKNLTEHARAGEFIIKKAAGQ